MAAILSVGTQRVHALQAHAEKHRVIIGAEAVQGEIAAQSLATFQRNAADAHEPIDLACGESVHGLVAGDAVFVQSAGLGACVEQHDIMALGRQPMRRRKAGRPGADHGHTLSGGGAAGEGMRAFGHQVVGGIALQGADLDGLALGLHPHAGALAQVLGRADPRADPAKDVLVKDGQRRRIRGAGRNLADEQRNVDAGGAGGDARRVIAEIAAIGCDTGLIGIKRRGDILKLTEYASGGKRPGATPGVSWLLVMI